MVKNIYIFPDVYIAANEEGEQLCLKLHRYVFLNLHHALRFYERVCVGISFIFEFVNISIEKITPSKILCFL